MNNKTILINKFPAELHKRLKIRAAENQTSMADLIVEAIKKYLGD